MNGYTFFVSKLFTENKDKETECIHRTKHSETRPNYNDKIMFQVKNPYPMDFLDKMPNRDKDLKLMCEQSAHDFLKNEDTTIAESQPKGKGNNAILIRSQDEQRFLVSSKPYVRKNNCTADRSLCFCWEIHLRFDEFDIYVSILRRSYIPPIMDMFQDIVICSRFGFGTAHFNKNKVRDAESMKKNNDTTTCRSHTSNSNSNTSNKSQQQLFQPVRLPLPTRMKYLVK